MPAGLVAEYQGKADQIDHVLIDVFDTLVVRTVAPEHVKCVVCRRLAEHYGTRLRGEWLYAARRELERELCEAQERRSGELEFRLDDLNRALLRELQAHDAPTFGCVSDATFVQVAREIELQVELLVQRPDEDVRAFLHAVQRRGVPITAVTDTYLPPASIETMLERHALRAFIRDVFVSNAYMETKRRGSLYDRVLRHIGVVPGRTLMVGDHELSDAERARSRGLQVYLIDRQATRARYQAFVELHREPAGVLRELERCIPATEIFGELACVLLLFTARLHAALASRGAGDAFFLSREGEFLRELFDAFQEISGFTPGTPGYVRSHYLLVSRRSTFVPALRELERESFETLFRQYRRLSPGEFLDSLNIAAEDTARLAAACGIDLGRTEVDFPTSPPFFRLRRSDLFREAYERTRLAQRQLFRQYLAGFGVEAGANLHLVDVGWKGTIQDHIFRILDRSTSIAGYYLGLTDYADAGVRNHKHALVFNTIRPLGRFDLVYNANRALFEVLLAASHGSARRYELVDTRVEPVVEDIEQEIELHRTAIRPRQVAVRETFVQLAQQLSVAALGLEHFEEWLARKHFRLVYQPRREELAFFRRLYHFENFGPARWTTFASPGRVGWRTRVRNLLSFLREPTRLLAGGWWAPLTLHALGLGALSGFHAQRLARRYFGKNASPLRASLEHQADQIRDLRSGIERQSLMITERDAWIAGLQSQLASAAQPAHECCAALQDQSRMSDERDAEPATLRSPLQEKEVELSTAETEAAALRQRTEQLAGELGALAQRLGRVEDELGRYRGFLIRLRRVSRFFGVVLRPSRWRGKR